MKIIPLFIVLFASVGIRAICPYDALAPLPYVVDHAIWRGWHQTFIYIPNIDRGCVWAIVRLMKCLAVNGVASVVNAMGTVRIQARIGIVILMPRLRLNDTSGLNTLIKKLHEKEMNTAAYDWLIATRSERDLKYVNEILNATSIRFDQNIIAAYPSDRYRKNVDSLGLCDANFFYKINEDKYVNRNLRISHNEHDYYKCRSGSRNRFECIKTEYERNYYRTSDRFKNLTRNQVIKKSGRLVPLLQSGCANYNYSRRFEMTNISRFSLWLQSKKCWSVGNRYEKNEMRLYVVQYFKVKINSTLYAHFLGCWNREQSMSAVEVPYPVEARNFLGEELKVGRCNSTGDGSSSLEDDEPSAPALLDDVLHFLTYRLNSTSRSRYYSKLGLRTYEGTWTGLLGALLDHSVDIALEPVTADAPRHQDMDFIFPIAETMCNIYIRQQETSTVRDIFLAPFSARLVVCVVAVALVASLAVVLISKVAPSVRNRERPMGYTEALIWSTGILCQQGGNWTPPNPASSILLIVCLLFAVVTYNAYAAFITSVLSVRVASVDTVAAVLHSPNFKIGYIRNGADQMYLMSTKDSQLNAFYIRGYSDAENLVSSAEEGLARAAKQDYAFFGGQRAARSTLRSLSQARGRCAVRELPVHSTRAQLAFPLPRRSPYARPTLISLLQLRSNGALARLESALVPSMPECDPPAGFASARATDVRSALLLIVSGLMAATLLG
ncbi:uncharacterized protein LOC131845070 [Achroia grisella]|uniref:uncharacterized protein LOC131845070 n=1 Tax=Achroia grisella TaxID=688607 RepID=UPI0027D22F29|nr:uncharacterized protein LOC131845070 [Achroia grisella]